MPRPSLDRRDFLRGATALAAASFVGAAVSFDAFGDDGALANDVVDPDKEIGKPYQGWREGELDLHFIHTGVGENCFHIYPDGTTMLLDCGDRAWNRFASVSWNPLKSQDAACLPKPNASRRPGEWVARYIKRLRPDMEKIDYVMASHFHSDHTGQAGKDAGLGMKGLDKERDYNISGISQVGEYFRFGTAFDRGYPNYDQPTTWAPGERENLVKFWEYAEENAGLKREEFQVGALDQIKLVNAPGKYDFHIRNISRNGVVWGGEKGENIDFFKLYPKNKETSKDENSRSLAIVAQYGAFRFYTGGDVSGVISDESGKDVDIEGAVGRAVGAVDVCKTNHHSSGNAMHPSFVKEVKARVYVTCCWWMGHTNMKTAATMSNAEYYPGPRLLCPTDPHPLNAEKIKEQPWRDNLVERVGHVVVKVIDGGARYKVYYLTAEDESMKVDLVFGPFESKGNLPQA